MTKPNSRRKTTFVKEEVPWRDLKVSSTDKSKINEIIKNFIHPKDVETQDIESMEWACKLIIEKMSEQADAWLEMEPKF